MEHGESEIWGIVAPDTVGVLDGLGLRARYGFDYVFAGAASNAEVPSQAPALRTASRPSPSSAASALTGSLARRSMTPLRDRL